MHNEEICDFQVQSPWTSEIRYLHECTPICSFFSFSYCISLKVITMASNETVLVENARSRMY